MRVATAQNVDPDKTFRHTAELTTNRDGTSCRVSDTSMLSSTHHQQQSMTTLRHQRYLFIHVLKSTSIVSIVQTAYDASIPLQS